MFRRGILGFIAISLTIFVSAERVSAETDDNFTINYDIKYDVQETGETIVTQNTSITSLKNDIVPTTYTFKAKYMDIMEIDAQTNGKKTETRTEVSDKNETVIIVPFSTYEIGEGKQNTVVITYKTKSIASKLGEVWNIHIPGIQIPKTTSLYNINLLVPESLGPKIFISPTPSNENVENGKRVYYFTKENFTGSGVTASFGKYQSLNFNIKYQLSNPWIIGSVMEVAFPPDIKNIQQVRYNSIDPKPRSIRIDSDGNALALFWVGPKNKLEVKINGSAKILGRQTNPNFGGQLEDIPKNLIKQYTREQKYWEVKHPEIKKFADSLFDNTLNVSQNTKRIYDYITSNLTYDFSATEKETVERKGAVAALTQRGSWTCMEFTDLFIATSRAMGIPAREINGYAFTNDNTEKPISISLSGGDLLHSWAEYYDPVYGWVQIDPTWGTTSGLDYFSKLDTNHFAFVIKGKSSEYPHPAGVYRFNNTEKLVDVDFSQDNNDSDEFKPIVTVKKIFNFNPVKFVQGFNRYQIDNTSGYFLYDVHGRTLAPGQKMNIYLKNGETNLAVKDFRDKSYSIKIL